MIIRTVLWVTSLLLILAPHRQTHAAEWNLSVGFNDMTVRGAKPLEDAPDGSTSHTAGIQLAIHAKTNSSDAINERLITESGYFKLLLDDDRDELNPGRDPLWYRGHYQIKTEFMPVPEQFTLDMLFDADLMANSVTSVKRQIKLFAGLKGEYQVDEISAGIKTSVGRYSLELDDTLPSDRGYSNTDLSSTDYAYTIMADTSWVINEDFSIKAQAQTWQTSDYWVENQYEIQFEYDSRSWIKKSRFVVSIQHTEYNHEGYNLDDESATDYLPILPWTRETFLQIYLSIPFEY